MRAKEVQKANHKVPLVLFKMLEVNNKVQLTLGNYISVLEAELDLD